MGSTCRNCGNPLEASDQFCGTCGAPVPNAAAAGAAPPPPPPPPPGGATTPGTSAITARSVFIVVVVVAAAAAAFFIFRGSDDSPTSTLPPVAVSSTTRATTTTTAPVTTTTVAPVTTTAPVTPPPTAPPDVAAELPPGVPYSGYELVTNDTGVLEVSIPVEWIDRSGVAWVPENDAIGVALSAAPDYDAWLTGWTTPGLFLASSSTLGMSVDDMLDSELYGNFSESCSYDGRTEYDDGVYVGVYDSWIDCGGTMSDFIVIAAEPPDASAVVYMQFLAVTDADLDALTEAVSTFQLTGPPTP